MRNVFVSYSHKLDQDDADEFRERFGNDNMVFHDWSLENQDFGDMKDDTIKNVYIRPKIRRSSVTIVLIGKETGNRWWVDWEIYYSMLKTKDNDRNGVLGIRLPNKEHNTPKRMLVNKNYCQIIDMPETREILVGAIEAAYIVSRNTDPDLSMPLRKRNS